jgi:hypothetical protein
LRSTWACFTPQIWILDIGSLILWRYVLPLLFPHLREVVEQQAVDEDVAPTHFAKKDAVGGIVEKMDQNPGEVVVMIKDKA